MARFIGIDPGAKGYFCLLDTTTRDIEFVANPSLGIEATALCHWLMQKHASINIRMIGIEDVHAIFGTSAKSNFSFGYNVGVVHTIAALSNIGIDLVQPKIWQKACGIQFKAGLKPAERKAIVGARAIQLYPSAPLYGPQGGLLDGRSDALMIAHYLSLKYGGSLT